MNKPENINASQCLNCNTVAATLYCPACGQKKSAGRISVASLLHDIPHSILHIDKGFFYTFFQLIKRPGDAIAEYLAGKRVKHYKPLAYLIILCAVSSLVTHFRVGRLEQLGMQIDFSQQVFSRAIAIFFEKYPAVMFLLLTPVISFWSYIFNRESGYNYAENLVLNLFIISQFNIFVILNDLYLLYQHRASGSMRMMLIVFFFYMIYVYVRFFKSGFSLTGFLKRLLMYVIIIVTVLTTLWVCGVMTKWWWW